MPSITSAALSEALEASKQLMKQKSDKEAELAELMQALTSHGVDMKTRLVDDEGFPRAGLDIIAIRTLRQRIVYLQNDLRGLVEQSKAALEHLHTLKMQELKEKKETSLGSGSGTLLPPSGEGAQSAPDSADRASSAHQGGPSSRGAAPSRGAGSAASSASSAPSATPFARVDNVASGSPALAAGLAPGDLLLQFGSVRASNFTGMPVIATLVRESENTPVDLVVDRRGEIVPLSLTPRRWSGQGLLGCLIVPLPRT